MEIVEQALFEELARFWPGFLLGLVVLVVVRYQDLVRHWHLKRRLARRMELLHGEAAEIEQELDGLSDVARQVNPLKQAMYVGLHLLGAVTLGAAMKYLEDAGVSMAWFGVAAGVAMCAIGVHSLPRQLANAIDDYEADQIRMGHHLLMIFGLVFVVGFGVALAT